MFSDNMVSGVSVSATTEDGVGSLLHETLVFCRVTGVLVILCPPTQVLQLVVLAAVLVTPDNHNM